MSQVCVWFCPPVLHQVNNKMAAESRYDADCVLGNVIFMDKQRHVLLPENPLCVCVCVCVVVS